MILLMTYLQNIRSYIVTDRCTLINSTLYSITLFFAKLCFLLKNINSLILALNLEYCVEKKNQTLAVSTLSYTFLLQVLDTV